MAHSWAIPFVSSRLYCHNCAGFDSCCRCGGGFARAGITAAHGAMHFVIDKSPKISCDMGHYMMKSTGHSSEDAAGWHRYRAVLG